MLKLCLDYNRVQRPSCQKGSLEVTDVGVSGMPSMHGPLFCLYSSDNEFVVNISYYLVPINKVIQDLNEMSSALLKRTVLRWTEGDRVEISRR